MNGALRKIVITTSAISMPISSSINMSEIKRSAVVTSPAKPMYDLIVIDAYAQDVAKKTEAAARAFDSRS